MVRGYTTIEQSRKLAEFLPLESADMYIDCTNPYYIHTELKHIEHFDSEHYPCWSLAALLGVLPNENIIDKTSYGKYYCLARNIITENYDNSVDACYEMILKLHELKML